MRICHLSNTIITTTAQEYSYEPYLGPQRIKSLKSVLISNPALQISAKKTGVTACCNQLVQMQAFSQFQYSTQNNVLEIKSSSVTCRYVHHWCLLRVPVLLASPAFSTVSIFAFLHHTETNKKQQSNIHQVKKLLIEGDLQAENITCFTDLS